MSKFIVASRQATGLDKTRVLLEMRIQEVKDEAKKWAEVAAKAKDDATEKDLHLEELQKKYDEQGALLSKAKEDAVAEFKASKQYTDILDTNYAAGFEDFRMDATEKFPNVDFSSIILNLNATATSSLLHAGSEDTNIEDDATTLPQDGSNVDAPSV